MTYCEAIAAGEKVLAHAGIIDARVDSWLLLEMACRIDRQFYYMHMDEEMTAEQTEEFKSLLKKRGERIPLQYITGEQEFMGLTFHVNSHVLIPRQDTETLVEEALKHVEPGMQIMDMCTGSGCILISVLKNSKDTTGCGYDISKQAINVAKENAKWNDVAADFEKSDLFENATGTYDMILSNPPYIRTDEIMKLMPEVTEFEPVQALDGKEDGLYFYRRIIKECRDFLNPGAYLIFEIGYDQGKEVSEMMEYAGFSGVAVIKDLAHNDRVVIGRWMRDGAEKR